MHRPSFVSTMTIKNKILLAMFILSTCLIIFLLTATSLIFYSQLSKQQISATSRQLESISSQLSLYLTSADNYSKSAISDPAIQRIGEFYEEEEELYKSEDLYRGKEALRHIIQSTDYIHSATLYSATGNYLISTENFQRKTPLSLFLGITKPVWISTIKLDNSNNSKEIHTLSLFRPYYSYSTGRFLGYMEISIREASISSLYENAVTDKNKIFIVDDQGTIQSSMIKKELQQPYDVMTTNPLPLDFSYYYRDDQIIFLKSFPYLNWYLVDELQTSVFFHSIYFVILIFILCGIFCILLVGFIASKISTTITRPLQKLILHTKKITDGDWSPIKEEVGDQDIKQLFSSFNNMIFAQKELKNTLVNTQKSKDKMLLDLLQQQINPHFLYNTLDNICSLAELEEKDLLIKLVMNLSNFYRQALSNGKAIITLKQELDLTCHYLEVLQIRYHNKFNFSIECPKSFYSIPCLKLLLQPIVENSIYHGIKEIKGKGDIWIQVKEEREDLHIIITDNGIGISTKRIQEIWMQGDNSFGLKNIHRRIQLYWGDYYGLSITSGENQIGCKVTLSISKKLFNEEAII